MKLWMPILHGPKLTVHFSFLSEEWAQRNHGQSLTRLAERGGLGCCEMAANLERRPWHIMSEYDALQVIERITKS